MSQIEVVNQALLVLETDEITNINDDSERAGIMRRFYDPSRKFVLRDNDFNNTSKWAVGLTADPNAPAWPDIGEGDIRGFRKPNDQLRILEAFVEGRPMSWWKVQGNYIYANAETIDVRYTYDADIGQWDEAAKECLVFYLAYKAARAITQSDAAKQDALKDYGIAQSAAKVSSALEGTSDHLRSPGRLTRVRNTVNGRHFVNN